MTTITNNFHGTQYRTRMSPAEIRRIMDTNPDNRDTADRRFVRRCRRALCGMTDCTCGGELGERGPQGYDQRT